jgi:hypothetical protein
MYKNPKVKFVISAKQDIKNYVLFHKYSSEKFLNFFLPTELQYILNKKFPKKNAEDEIQKYIKEKFKTEKQIIAKNTKNLRTSWDLIENKYFDLIGQIFKGHQWPEGKYIGFASVFNMYPRNIKEKTFYFSALQKNSHFGLATIAHEMLHFMFYDYLKKKYNINVGDKFNGKSERYLWDISETFNLVIETWKPYQRIFITIPHIKRCSIK